MGWLSVLVALAASGLLYDRGHPVLLPLSVVAVIGCFWSWGIMHNLATRAASRRSNYSGHFYDITEEEADSVSNWITYLNFSFSVLALLLLIAAIVMSF